MASPFHCEMPFCLRRLAHPRGMLGEVAFLQRTNPSRINHCRWQVVPHRVLPVAVSLTNRPVTAQRGKSPGARGRCPSHAVVTWTGQLLVCHSPSAGEQGKTVEPVDGWLRRRPQRELEEVECSCKEV